MINLIKKFRNYIRHILIGNLTYEHLDIQKEIENLRIALGKHEARIVKSAAYSSIQEAEFKVFSQFGEDGIIQYLISKIEIPNKIFIELGVGDYSESSTRFLLLNNNWQGKIINYGDDHITFLHSDSVKDVLYTYKIDAVSAFIDKENINVLIKEFNFPNDVGLLSIDLDGVDYWIWEAIDSISPRIVIVEYNSHFGSRFPISVEYKKDFDRTKEHSSNLYFGASLKALYLLAKKKKYRFVGSNSAGNNAFFVRDDVAGNLPNLTVEEGYVKSMIRESKDSLGNFTYISDHEERLRIIRKKIVYETQKKKMITIEDLFHFQ